jgi:hypothetical protein
MLDLSKKVLPRTIVVRGKYYQIHTDFRYFLIVKRLLKNKIRDITAFKFMYVDKVPLYEWAGLKAIIDFMNSGSPLPRGIDEDNREIVIDYDIDAELIYSAFLENYNIDLLKTDLHWWQFKALLCGLHDTKLNDVISFRLYKPSGKNDEYEKYKQQQYDAWRIITAEEEQKLKESERKDKEALESFLSNLR